MSIEIKRWMANSKGKVVGGSHCITVAVAICNTTTGMSVQQYIARTQAWRPLDIHPDWRTWEGATKGNK